jgi:hypothetical protein
MTFPEFKKQVMRLAKQQKIAHLIPSDNDLIRLFERGLSPEQVVSGVQSVHLS